MEEAAASTRGETLSEFVRRAARAEAERVLAQPGRYVVDDAAARRFLEALDQDERYEPGLRRLVDASMRIVRLAGDVSPPVAFTTEAARRRGRDRGG